MYFFAAALQLWYGYVVFQKKKIMLHNKDWQQLTNNDKAARYWNTGKQREGEKKVQYAIRKAQTNLLWRSCECYNRKNTFCEIQNCLTGEMFYLLQQKIKRWGGKKRWVKCGSLWYLFTGWNVHLKILLLSNSIVFFELLCDPLDLKYSYRNKKKRESYS